MIIDQRELRKLANQAFGETVDTDFAGNAITNYDVLLSGAFAPAVMRLVNLAVEKHAQLAAAPAQAEPSDDAKDAARYRHIVTAMATYGVPFNPPKQHGIEFSPLPLVTAIEDHKFWTDEPSKAEVDAAIDADMKA